MDLYYGQKIPLTESSSLPGRDAELSTTISFKKSLQIPNIGEFSTENEELCRYAEASVVLGQKVMVTFSGFLGSSERLTKGDLYHIRMISESRLPEMGI